MNDKDEIAALCQRLGQAHYDRDADAILACYSADALYYNLAPPLSRRGMDPRGLAEWLATWNGPIIVEAEEVDLTVERTLAYTSALNRMRGKKVDGAEVDIWFRTTMCFRRLERGWLIVHDHSSTPFYMDGSFKAAVDLKPEETSAGGEAA